ncbi:hypothetical protein EDD21DRAFT_364505 [Dissophora ornata]|nr:hypothetical protein BGZ58_008286 [Dissophora ornata]KAI8605102.1 hypothetical protein EDD21DRAFT_364505 [Dissophora ornata]
MNTERPAMLISTAAAAVTQYEKSGSLLNQHKARIMELPSPPLSPQQDSNGFGNLELELEPELEHNIVSTTTMATTLMSKGYSVDMPEVIMSTPEWLKMQTHINSLETEISHVTRTNELLNQELDKVNGYLERWTSQEGAGWRKEYEFLVQQVDVMHRQLQIAYSQMGHGGGAIQLRQDSEGDVSQPDTTRQLREEVKELTSSLKTWQSALHKAEENYRRKCEGERALKQTLREREAQLSSLAERLNGHDSDIRKSVTNYQELVRFSAKLESEGKKQVTTGADSLTSASESSGGSSLTDSQNDQMPGVFPERQSQSSATVNGGDLSASILSWAALLATYMLS